MYCRGSVETSITNYYRNALQENGYTPDDVEEMLEELDFDAVTKALDGRSKSVPAYEVREYGEASPDFLGKSLFSKNAAMIYWNNALSVGNPVEIEGLVVSKSREVWLLEDGNIYSVWCVSTYFLEGDFTTYYREIIGDPYHHGADLNLRLMTDELKEMCGG